MDSTFNSNDIHNLHILLSFPPTSLTHMRSRRWSRVSALWQWNYMRDIYYAQTPPPLARKKVCMMMVEHFLRCADHLHNPMDDVIHALIDLYCWLRTTEKSLNGHQTYFRERERVSTRLGRIKSKGRSPKLVNEETACAQQLSLFTNISQCFDQCSTKIMKDLYNNKKMNIKWMTSYSTLQMSQSYSWSILPSLYTTTNLCFSITDSTAGRTETPGWLT